MSALAVDAIRVAAYEQIKGSRDGILLGLRMARDFLRELEANYAGIGVSSAIVGVDSLIELTEERMQHD